MDRRQVLASADSGWTPQSALPLAWFYAASTYVTLAGSSVSGWLDRSGRGNNLDQSSGPSQPTWEASGGWSASKPSILFAAQSLNTVTGQILSVLSGNDRPFTALATCQPTSYANALTVCSWDDTLITARQNCTLTTGQFMSAKREADSGTNNTVTATGPLVGTGHVRLAYVFSGSGAAPEFTAYLNGVQSVSGALAVGTSTFSRFRLGDGPEVGPDSFTGRMVEFVLYSRALSAPELSAYYNYSLSEWG